MKEAGTLSVNVSLQLISYSEEGYRVLYSPALDLYGYGNDLEEAKKSFHFAVEEFLRYTLENQTIFKELKKCGWKMRNNRIHAPNFDQIVKKNKMVSELLSRPGLDREFEEIKIPAFA